MFISSPAFQHSASWIEVGWHLWQEVDASRDYFLGLPTPDLQRWNLHEAADADALAMSRSVVLRLRGADGEPLVTSARAEHFWTEQGDRATLISLAACLSSIREEWLSELGRWSAKMSATYIRTHAKRVRMTQGEVANAVRSSRGQLDKFGEADLFAAWAAFMMDHGVPEAEAVQQASRVASASVVFLGGSVLSGPEGASQLDWVGIEGALDQDLLPLADVEATEDFTGPLVLEFLSWR